VTPTRSYDAVVIGAGHNGLVCAAYLAKAGLRTLVLEGSGRVGGALATGEIEPGVRAPTYAHTIGRLRSSVVRDLRLTAHGLRTIRPDVRAFAPQPDGRSITLWANAAATANELRAWSSKDADAYPRFDRKVRALASFLAYLHAATPPDIESPSLADALAGMKLGRALRGLGGAGHTREALRVLPMAVADLVGEEFETVALRGVLAARGVRLAAMGPWSAGTALHFLADSVGGDGGAAGETVYAMGGPGALADALAGAVRAAGAEIRYGAAVVAVAGGGDRVTGVVLGEGEEIAARAVVSGADPKRTLTRLVDPVALGPRLAWRAGNIRTPGVVAKVNLSLAALPTFPVTAGDEPHRLHGRILIAPSVDYLERAFDHSKYGRISEEPFLEATIPTLTDPTLAPPDRHVMSILFQYAPYRLRGEGLDERRDEIGDLTLRTLERYAPGLTAQVTARQVITPLDLERDLGLTEGHPLHGEPALDQFFAWRPLFGHARYRLGLPGLYLCGSGAHPGGGVTGAPGANCAREVLADLRRRGV